MRDPKLAHRSDLLMKLGSNKNLEQIQKSIYYFQSSTTSLKYNMAKQQKGTQPLFSP